MKLANTLLLALGLVLAPAAMAQDAPAPAANTTAAAPAATQDSTAAPAAAPKVEATPETPPVAGVGMPVNEAIHLQDQVTPNGRKALWMHNYILVPMMVGISLLVMLLLLFVIVRFRRAANPNPSRTSHNTVIEVIWTLVPVLILVAIAVPSISLLAAQFKPAGKDALTIKAIGNQWYWTYSYPDNGGFELVSNMLHDQPTNGARARTDADGPRLLAVDNRLVIPVNREIRLLTTSNDVIHSFAVPSFWVKMDAVPGRINEVTFKVDKEGVYYGQCSELCGARHGFMPIAVEVVSAEKFAAWVAAKGGTMPGAAPKAAETPAAAATGAPAETAAAATANAAETPSNAAEGAAAANGKQ